jgi:hypothetical protein
MNQAIRDDAAIAFSTGFYRALGYGRSIEEAFEFGKNAIQLEISGSSKIRSAELASESVTRAIKAADAIESTNPEDRKPVLKIKPTLNLALEPTIATPAQPLSQATVAAIQADIDQSLDAEIKTKPYRDLVRGFLDDRKLSALETIRLERLRKDLGLSVAEATQILEEEQAPIRKAQDDYEAMLIGLIEAGHYPLDIAIETELKTVQQELRLSDEEVEAIATPILDAAKEDYQARVALQQQQEYAQKLQRYEQEFSKAIATQYPISLPTRETLRQLQQSLQLRYEDVTQLEEPLITFKEADYEHQQAEQRQRERQQYFQEPFTPQSVKTILVLAVNRKEPNPPRLREEIRSFEAGLERSRYHGCHLLQGDGVVMDESDLLREILHHRPEIIHFAGDSVPSNGVEPVGLMDVKSGRLNLMSSGEIDKLFGFFRSRLDNRLDCVVLNACYSERQARAIARHIPYVVGMKQTIDDQVAIDFAIDFYDALAAGKSVEFAFRIGCSAISVPSHLMPVLICN